MEEDRTIYVLDPSLGLSELGGELFVYNEDGIEEPCASDVAEILEEYEKLQNEYEKYRRHNELEFEKHKKYCHEDLLVKLLGVVDNFERALQHNSDTDAFRKGVEMILCQLRGVLEKFGCVRFESLGKRFDPHFHEAMERVVDEKMEPMTVVHEFLAGYMYHDRVIRAALVSVCVREDDGY